MKQPKCLIPVLALVAACASEAPRERVLTDARPLVAGIAREAGEDCTNTGRDGCSTGLCLKFRQGLPGEHVCTKPCRHGPNGNGCPASWSCVQVYQRDDGFFCLPPSDWAPRVAPPAGVRQAQSSLPLTEPFAPPSRDGGSR